MSNSQSNDTPVDAPIGATSLKFPPRWLAMMSLQLGISMAILDGAIANVALPTLGKDFHVSASQTVWIVNAFQIALAMGLIPLAALGEFVSYRRVFIRGLIVFVGASLGCAAATTFWSLVAARFVQGLGAAGLLSINIALVRVIYPPDRIARGLSLNATMVSVWTAVGPSVAAGLLAVLPWQSIFLINLPIGLVAYSACRRWLPFTSSAAGRLDIVASIFDALAFASFLMCLNEIAHDGPFRWIWTTFVLAGISGGMLFRRQSQTGIQLLATDLFRIQTFTLSIGGAMLVFAAQALAFIALPFYFETQLGRSVSESGLLLSAWPAAIALSALAGGSLANKVSAVKLGAVGCVLLSGGLLSFIALPTNPTAVAVVWRLCLCGAGFGLFQTPNTRTALMAVPINRSGGASGIMATGRLFGQALGAVAATYALRQPDPATLSFEIAAAMAGLACLISVQRKISS